VKSKLYARFSLGEYWVLDVQARELQVFREPGSAGYGLLRVLTETMTLEPLAVPTVSFTVREFFL